MDRVEYGLVEIEIHKKIALAASCLVFVLVGMPLAIKIHRREKTTSFGIGLVLFGIYWGIFLTGIVVAESTKIPPWLGVWLANIVIGFLGLALFLQLSRR
jgi:lipopolysaccharide export system permease protein